MPTRRAERIDAVMPLSQAALAGRADQARRAAGAVLSVVEAGHLKAGDVLTDERRRFKATVRPDGQLDVGVAIGSIHKVGALVQGLPACNGWTFWHVERAGKLVVIDTYRAKLRAVMDKAG